MGLRSNFKLRRQKGIAWVSKRNKRGGKGKKGNQGKSTGVKKFSKGFRNEFNDVIEEDKLTNLDYHTRIICSYDPENIKEIDLPDTVEKWVETLAQKHSLGADIEHLTKIGEIGALSAINYYKNKGEDIINNKNLLTSHIEYWIYNASIMGDKDIPINPSIVTKFLDADKKLNFDKIVQEEDNFIHSSFGLEPSEFKVTDKIQEKFDTYIDYIAEKNFVQGMSRTQLINAGKNGLNEAVKKYRIDEDNIDNNLKPVLNHIDNAIKERSREDLHHEKNLRELISDKAFKRERSLSRFLKKNISPKEYKLLEEDIIKIESQNHDESWSPIIEGFNLAKKKLGGYENAHLSEFKFHFIYDGERGRNLAIEGAKHFLENVLKIKKEDIAKAINPKLFRDYGYATLFYTYFGGSTQALIKEVYPEIESWEVEHRGRLARWDKQKGLEGIIEKVKWVIEEKEKIPLGEIPQKVNNETFKKYGLYGMVQEVGGWRKAVMATYPDIFTDYGDVNSERKREITGELDEEQRKKTEEIIDKFMPYIKYAAYSEARGNADELIQEGRISVLNIIKKHGIEGINEEKFSHLVHSSVAGAIKGYKKTWMSEKDKIITTAVSLDKEIDEDDSRSAKVIDLVNNISNGNKNLLEYTRLDRSPKSKRKSFFGILEKNLERKEYQNLEDKIKEYYYKLENKFVWCDNNWDPFDEAFNFLTENVPKYANANPWDFNMNDVWVGCKGLNLAAQATRNLFEEKLGISIDQIPKISNSRLFHENGLGGMIQQLFNQNAYLAVNNAYPNKFKPWEFKNMPHMWEMDNGKEIAAEATKWLFEEKLGISPDEVLIKGRAAHFKNNHLYGLMMQLFSNNNQHYYKAIMNAYPERIPEHKINEVINFIKKNVSPLEFDVYLKSNLKIKKDGEETIPELKIIREIHTHENWDPVEEGINILKKYVPRYNEANFWEFDYKNKWVKEGEKEKAKEAVKWLIEKEDLEEKDIPLKLSAESFKEHKLEDMLDLCYHGSIFDAVNEIYPGKFKPYLFKHSQHSVWKGENARKFSREAVRYFLELVQNSEEYPDIENVGEVSDVLSRRKELDELSLHDMEKIIRNHDLTPLLDLFNGSVWKAFNNSYPYMNQWTWKDWDIFNAKYKFDIAKDAVRWVIRNYQDDKKIKITYGNLPDHISRKTFEEYGINNILEKTFNNSVYSAINNAFPHKFYPWQFNGEIDWKDKDHRFAAEAVRWLVEKRIGISPKEAPKKITKETLKDNNLGGIIESFYEGSLFDIMDNAYPNTFYTWEFPHDRFWKEDNAKDNAIAAVKWVIEEKEKIPIEQVPYTVTRKLFGEYGLSNMLKSCFNDSYRDALITAYPGKFTEDLFDKANDEERLKNLEKARNEKIRLDFDKKIRKKFNLDNRFNIFYYKSGYVEVNGTAINPSLYYKQSQASEIMGDINPYYRKCNSIGRLIEGGSLVANKRGEIYGEDLIKHMRQMGNYLFLNEVVDILSKKSGGDNKRELSRSIIRDGYIKNIGGRLNGEEFYLIPKDNIPNLVRQYKERYGINI